ncbi:dTDP-4-amino-4,6-dideoxygalactose transaminase [Altibacter sp. HG106]|uniref:dTDP-4-amino-4,6-dideoxygalactose transaminase n=1 Tax=Altibacter sp. HG106 TaxID=3023937 RepID=UPI002350873B|nr:dTDP-4-amino-4,6-dideoxygalactose transaminase [Altibacter sp. HG106]MDC7995697.1 dTDP-4-amino-4,6-dideoxygalactose transaminase [Altibacter sp. HG106]
MIPFNKPYITGKELRYIEDAVARGQLSGNGDYTKKCHAYFESTFRFPKVLLTTSCTDALEMAAILLHIQPGDEVIMPAYTFVSTANAFVLRGATIRFVDSRSDHPGMDEHAIEALINDNTKAIVVVHYAGVACDMDLIQKIADTHNLAIVEDAAQAFGATYKGKPLGSFGALSAFSFHETKNIQCGEGGLLVINEENLQARAEIIWEKGTNRSAFFRGEIDKYGWVDIGSSFLPSELNAAYLFAQLEESERIQKQRTAIWEAYYKQLKEWAARLGIQLPVIPDYAINNAHMFYLFCRDNEQRTRLIQHLKAHGVHAVFHYLSLHESPFYYKKHDGRALQNSDQYTERLVRLPLYYELDPQPVIKALLGYDS